MVLRRAALFRGRHFTDEIIVLCVRWYLRYSLSYSKSVSASLSRRYLQHCSNTAEGSLRRTFLSRTFAWSVFVFMTCSLRRISQGDYSPAVAVRGHKVELT